MRLVKVTSLFICLVSSYSTINAQQTIQKPKDSHAAEWQKIMDLHFHGQALLTSNSPDQIARRKVIYSRAASLLEVFRNKYDAEKNSIVWLRLTCRLGIYMELAGQPEKALENYKLCRKHQMIDSPAAIYNKERIKQLVSERIEFLSHLESAQGATRGDNGRTTRIPTIGPITLPPVKSGSSSNTKP